MLSELTPSVDRVVRTSGRKVLERVPSLEHSMLTARDRYARAFVGLRGLVNDLRYAAPPEPYRLIRVDPGAIERGIRTGRSKFLEAAVVAGGDWDRDGFRFRDLDVYQAYAAHFEHGVAWSETAFYDRVVSEIESGTVRWGCRTESEFRERCRRLERLYDRLETDGYRSQAELLGDRGSRDGVDDPIDFGRRSELLTERMKDEIAVHIDRDGEFCFADGRNRLSMAKIIGLDHVVVRVLRRHSDWQAVPDAYVHGEPWTREYADHPDLVSLEFDSA